MITSILLAAGQSTRMNGENKLIKKIYNIPLISHSIKNILNSSVDNIVVVLGHQREIIEKIIERNKKIKIVFNKNFKNGLSSSIKIGLKHLPYKTEFFLICLADMPMINKNIYNQIIALKNHKKIIVPTYKGMQANPVLFPISMREKIMNVYGDFGAKKILESNKKKVIKLNINDDAIKLDFNTQDSFVLK